MKVNYKESNRKAESVMPNIMLVPIKNIRSNPFQPRRGNSNKSITELVPSINEFGIMNPICVRTVGENAYELIAGERRFKAAILCGLDTVPVNVMDVSEESSAILNLVENLQRENLSYMEEADAYYTLLSVHGLTQQEIASKVGKSQSAIANKIRLLRLPKAVKEVIRDNGLTERHARAVLKIQDEDKQLSALKTICNRKYSVRQTEEYVERICNKCDQNEDEEERSRDNPFGKSDLVVKNEAKGNVKYMIRDIKIFINTIRSTVLMLKDAGVEAQAAQFNKSDCFEFVVRIPKSENGLDKGKLSIKQGNITQVANAAGISKEA